VNRSLPHNLLLVGDVRTELPRLPAASVDTCITSPPYFWLRNYEVPGQIGMERQVDLWVEELRLVLRGLARVLKPEGSVWLNVADSYSRHPRYGAPAKSLLLGPERLAVALVADGWIVRNRIAWTKPNPMPNSVNDRLNATWEFVYFLTRSPHYYFDLNAIRVLHRTAFRSSDYRGTDEVPAPGRPNWAGPLAGSQSGLHRLKRYGIPGHPRGKNPGDHWALATASFRGQHFATFPKRLVERPLLATCPERVCQVCGRAWERVPQRRRERTGGEIWRSACGCGGGWEPGLVLDPFFGAGTVGLVAEALGRQWCGIELNARFAAMAKRRIEAARAERDGGERRAA
jgi:site-specific DNA-methyltransferase (adenine-specific)